MWPFKLGTYFICGQQWVTKELIFNLMEIRFKFNGAVKTRRTNALFFSFFLSPSGGSRARKKKVGVWTRRAAQPTSASQSFQAKEALLSPHFHLCSPPPRPQSPPRTLCIHPSSLYFPRCHTIQTASRYTNKQRQQSIVPEGVRWASLP